MQKELLEDIKINHQKYVEQILEAIQNEIYQYERYEVNFSLAIGATCSKVDMEGFAKLIRETDKFIILDEHICCVVFPFTDAGGGIKAASNLLSKFEMQFFSEKVYIGIVNAKDCETPAKQTEALFQILKYAIENGMQNMPLDNTSL